MTQKVVCCQCLFRCYFRDVGLTQAFTEVWSTLRNVAVEYDSKSAARLFHLVARNRKHKRRGSEFHYSELSRLSRFVCGAVPVEIFILEYSIDSLID